MSKTPKVVNVAPVSDNEHKFSLLFTDQLSNCVNSADLLQPGDCGIILRSDGTFQAFSSTSPDVGNASFTECNLEAAQKLTALSVALANPQVMAVLLNISSEIGAI